MRIGIDVRALMEGKITGVETYIVNLLEALFRLDKKNEYLLFVNSFKDTKKKLIDFNFSNVSYRIFSYPNKLFNLSQKIIGVPRLDKLLGGIDLFFSPHWRHVALNPGVPLIVTFHDLSFKFLPEYFTKWQRIWHRFMDYGYAAKRASRLIAVSEATKQDIMSVYRVPEKKIKVIYSGAKASVITNESGQSLSLPQKYFLSLSTFEPRKNLSGVLAAYEEYRKRSKVKLPLVLAGSSGWKVEKKYSDPNIIVIENFSEADKPQLLLGAFAMLFVSFYEGFGFPILEAASSGLPVIGSYATSIAEIGKDFVLFVNPLRSSQIADAMLSLEQDDKYCERLKASGLAAVKNFDWNKTASEVLKLFYETV